MQIPEELLEKIKEQNDIVDIVSEKVRLKRSGKYYMGLCPFHHEKSSSFTVTQDKQIYKCFGCGEAGNVITFVMKTKNISFYEAVKYLAERANIPLDLGSGKKSKITERKEQLYKINTDAARFFFNNLYKSKAASEYFLRRGITESTIRKFGLGYSIDSWNALLNHLKTKGYTQDIILDAGLILKNEKGNIYDRFRNRVMFPVFDYKGKVMGFGGRVLDDSKPKYLNSPETLIFQKGTNLYGLNFAIKNGLPEKYFIIVEGYMDCISLHQFGITNVVASLGTALTINQARLLKRYADKVIISYDADLAGQKATIRGLEILRNAGFDVRVLTVPEGKDPDEYIRSNGKEAFIRLIDLAQQLIDYRLSKAKDDIDFSNNEKLIEYGERVTEVLANLNPVEKDVYVRKIAEETGIREQALYDLLANKMTKSNEDYKYVNNKEENGTKLYVEPAYLKAERSLIKLMINSEFYAYIIEHISKENLILESHRKLYTIINELINEGKEELEKSVELRCDDAESLKEWIYIKELDIVNKSSDIEVLIKDYIYQLKKHNLEKKKKELIYNLKMCEEKGMFQESLKLAKEAKEIDDKLKRLKRG
ncbi:DNA primase [Clostridium polyendosporum]|uniref:DNA primase n=1 Tax=Clostridium polyendosporum TaxID=69208 RepID=A0A919RZX9_9CLOT|nr:DNA primase [Clostridium polyendosporum]GIM28058.1 DNA primase [Clostridium polyendosporum]